MSAFYTDKQTNKQTPRSRILLEKLIVTQLVLNLIALITFGEAYKL